MILANEGARRRMRLGLAMLAVAACAEHATSPSTVGTPGAPVTPTPSPTALARVICTVDVPPAVVSCPASSATANVDGFAQDVVVRFGVSNTSYTGQVFSFDVAVTNLIPQSLGTVDGETADPNGVRVFFAGTPTVTVGTGAIDFVDPATGALMVDGLATFTAPRQAFHRYAGMLGTSETSAAKRWRIHVPTTVTSFTFAIDVNAAVPRPFGWVDVTPGAPALRAGQTTALTAVARNVVGTPIVGATLAWSSNVTGVATVDAATGVVTAVSDGSATITATNTVGTNTRTGDVIVTVQTASPATTTLMASPVTLAAGATATITVRAKNAAGANLNVGGDAVALSVDSGTVSTVTDRGDGTYTALLTSIVARGSRVTGTINGAALAASASVRFTAAGPVAIAKLRGDGQRASVGTAVPAPPSVVLLDANGNLVPDVEVTFAVVSGGGVVIAAATKTNASGEATVGGWTLGSTVGPNTLTATAGALTATFTATAEAGPLAIIGKLAGDGQGAVGGGEVGIAPSVRITDARGNPVAGVAVTFTPSAGGRVEGGTQITGADGVATVGRWMLRIAVGLDTLTVTAGDLVTTFTAAAVSGPAASIAKTGGDGQTTLVGTAVPSAPSVKVTDARGNPKVGAAVTFAVATGGGSVTGGMQTTNASGVATAGGWTLGGVAGTNTLTATTGSLATTFTATGVAGGASTMTKAAGDGQSATVGTAVTTSPAVRITDANGNPVANVSVTFSVASGGGSVSGGTQTTDASGIATAGGWTLGAVTGANNNTLIAAAAALNTTFAASAVAGALDHFVVEAQNGGAIGAQEAGAALVIRVTARDAHDNTVTGFTGTVNLTSNLAGSGLVTSAAFTAGVLTHSITFTQTGPAVTIVATRSSGGTQAGTSGAFVVNPGAVDHFLVEAHGGGAIATQTAGTSFSVRITAQDANGNTVPGFAGTADLTSNRAPTTIGTTGAFTAGLLASYPITLTQSGTNSTVTVTRTGSATTSGTSAPFTVNAGALHHFAVETQAGGAIPTQTAATSFNIRVSARDANGNTVTGFTGTVDLTSNRAPTTLGTTAPFTSGVLASHSVTLAQSGAGATITATRSAGGTENGTSGGFAVNPGPLHHFAVAAQSGGGIATQVSGAPFNVRITAQDAGGNTVVGFAGTVNLTSNGGPLTPGTSAAFTAGVLASQSVMLTQPGASVSITATNGAGSESGTSGSFQVDPAAVHHFDVEAQAGGAIPAQTAGQSFNIKVTARDANNNVATGFTGAVNVTSSRTGVSGLAQSAAFTAGVLASHAVTLTQAGAGATITATRSSGGSENGVSTGFVVGPASIGHIAVQAGDNQNATVNSAVAGAVQAVVRDAFNNPVPNANVTFLVTGGGGSATGTARTTNASGIATLGGWTLGQTAGTNTLTATVGVLAPATFTATGTAGAAASVAVQAGGAQSASVNTNVAIAPAVIVKDAFNNIVPGVTVTFAVTGGGGSVTGGSATANVNGIATVGSWRLGATAGANTLSATVASLTPATFTATGAPGAAANIAVNAGGGQTATVNTAVATAPKVLVIDAEGNPKPGASVTFTPSGNGITSPANGVVTTDANGFAALASWTLGTASGSQTLTATVTSTSIAATLNATATAGAPASVAVSAGNNQIATVNTVVSAAPGVIVRDAFGNPAPNAGVTFAVTGGGGTATGTSRTTNASGVATVGSWTLGTTTGTNTLTATVGALTPATFSATGAAGAPTSIAMQAGNGQTAAVHTNVATPPSVLVKDVFNNVVPGATVTFVVTSGGGAIVPATGAAASNASGVATLTSWRLGDTAGPNSLSATVGALAPLTFTATGIPGAAANIAVNAGDGLTATVNTAIGTAPKVLVIDAEGNPKPGASVTFTPSGNGSTSPANGIVTTDANGFAALTSWTLGTVSGAQTLTATVTSTSITTTLNATATAGAPASVTVNAGNNQSATVNTAVSTAPAAIVKDAFNNPVPNVAVTFAVTGGGGTATGTSQTTNASGIATLGSWKLGAAPGTNTLTATVGPLTAATFTATGNAAIPASIAVQAGNNQSATVNTAVAVAPSVVVTDASNDPIAGVSVTFAVASGGGAITPANGAATTNSSGIATLTSWTLGTTAGANSLTATVSSTSITTTINATGTAGPLHHFKVESVSGGNIPTQTLNATFSVKITAQDANNNTATTFSGAGKTVEITSNRTGSSGLGQSAAFTNGVLASHSITLAQSGAGATITATRSPAGPESGTSNTFSVVVPPTVSATTPSNNAVNVAINSAIAVTFSVPVNATTASFTLECPTGVTKTYSLSASPATTFTLTPSAPLPAGQTCRVTVNASQVSDASTTALMAANHVFAFETRPTATDDTYPQAVPGNTLTISTISVTTNDVSAASFTITAFDATSLHGGHVGMIQSGANIGRFTYDPPVGYQGGDSFTYTITTSGGSTATATVSLTVSGLEWFVDANRGVKVDDASRRIAQ